MMWPLPATNSGGPHLSHLKYISNWGAIVLVFAENKLWSPLAAKDGLYEPNHYVIGWARGDNGGVDTTHRWTHGQCCHTAGKTDIFRLEKGTFGGLRPPKILKMVRYVH